MEFKTTQGGETTAVFDEGEQLAISDVVRRYGVSGGDVAQLLLRQRQADPLATFSQLIDAAFPPTAGVVPANLKTKKKLLTPPDPLVDLENLIRRRISAQQLPTGPTSQSHQAEATLLQALATCLLAQTMRDINAG